MVFVWVNEFSIIRNIIRFEVESGGRSRWESIICLLHRCFALEIGTCRLQTQDWFGEFVYRNKFELLKKHIFNFILGFLLTRPWDCYWSTKSFLLQRVEYALLAAKHTFRRTSYWASNTFAFHEMAPTTALVFYAARGYLTYSSNCSRECETKTRGSSFSSHASIRNVADGCSIFCAEHLTMEKNIDRA